MVSIIIAPPDARQVYVPPLGGIQHPLAPEVMNALRRLASRPTSLWRIINFLADGRSPDSRLRRRCWRLRYWGVVRELLKAKLTFCHGLLISVSDFRST